MAEQGESEKPTAEVAERGLRAYEQARAFERMRTWRLPVVYGAATVVPLMLAYSAWRSGQIAIANMGVDFASSSSCSWCSSGGACCGSTRRTSRCSPSWKPSSATRCPGVQVEEHFAALEELKREIAEGRSGND